MKFELPFFSSDSEKTINYHEKLKNCINSDIAYADYHGICGLRSKAAEINAQELCKITVAAYNGYATASAELDIEKINKFCDEKLSKSKTKDELKKYLKGVSVDVDCADSENGKLSNDAELTITLDINDEPAEKYGIKVSTNPFTYKVENLAEPTVIDVFEGLEISCKGIAPYLTSVDFVTDSCVSPYKEIKYVPVTDSDESANKLFGLSRTIQKPRNCSKSGDFGKV